ncbi:MAG: DUF3619 family protein [Betaproteobacteria bacterium]|nr:DUF3619 family protein [Betaproteobacteria bacterium]
MNMRESKMKSTKIVNPEMVNTEGDASLYAAEDQIASRIVDLLESQSQDLAPQNVEYLSAARGLAVGRLTELQADMEVYSGTGRHGNVMHWLSHHRIISMAMVIGTLLMLLFVAQNSYHQSNIEHSDAFLLASDLPPEAYADKGFNVWMDSN